MSDEARGKVITFYSYKGGTGRSMALANVAWMLATRGHRVLAIDWDLEAPGLHRYFEPLLSDPSLENSTGLMDFVLEFASAAVSGEENRPVEWYRPYSNILAHALEVDFSFGDGVLHLVPAGRQDAAYAARVNSFDWRQFYDKLGGGVWLEIVKEQFRQRYDYILIDSRTGVSDTSGICTVQMPDELVVCFTLNQQSIRGAAAVAVSALQQRRARDGSSSLTVWPIPMRVEFAETARLEIARALARTQFSRVLHQLSPEEEDDYWGGIEVAYHPYYAYEEVLAVFGDRPRQSSSMLSSVETITRHLTGQSPKGLSMPEDQRQAGLARFIARSASDYVTELKLIASEYEAVRARMPAGSQRTLLMTALVVRAQVLAGRHGAGSVAELLFASGSAGERIVALALAHTDVRRGHIELALDGIRTSRSPFEQFHALMLAERLIPLLDSTARQQLLTTIEKRLDRMAGDESRYALAQKMIKTLGRESAGPRWKSRSVTENATVIGEASIDCATIRPATPELTFDDVAEEHGPWLVSSGQHKITLPPEFGLARHLVTNELYLQFVKAAGYKTDTFWANTRRSLDRFVTLDGRTRGPANWPSADAYPEGRSQHPVTGISYIEATAFVAWANATGPDRGWRWSLPTENMWEFAARTEARLIYPWGDVFDPMKCNSSETHIGGTSEVTRFPDGASREACFDLAGNAWEFVIADDMNPQSCVLRGGSFRNNRYELRSYLRLFGVPRSHRPDDFGLRLAQIIDR